MKSNGMNTLQSLQLKEALSVLAALSGYGYLQRSGMENDERLPMFKMQGRNLLQSVGMMKPEAFKDGEVLGLDFDRKVMTWNDSLADFDGCTKSLDEYGVHDLKEHEIVRVGISHEAWTLARNSVLGTSRKPHGLSRMVFVGAFITGEFGDGPSFAKIVVTEAFIEQLERLTSLCEENRLSEARVTQGPDLWGGCDEQAMRLQCPELVVSMGSFWFCDRPKHMDYEFQTRGQQTRQFIDLALSEGDDPVFVDGVEEVIARATADEDIEDTDLDEGMAALVNGTNDSQGSAARLD